MGSIKKFMLGGLDTKSNDLVRDPMRASDMRNITKTLTGDIDKRRGYELVETAPFELEESIYYKTKDENIFIRSSGAIYKLINGTRQSCTIAHLATNVTLPIKNRIIYTEYLSNLYITTTDGQSQVIKYDGGDAYLSGVPAPNLKFNNSDVGLTSAGAGYYYRFFYQFKDLNGNITFGPYVQKQSTINNETITVSSFKTNNPYGSFYNKYLNLTYVDPAIPTQYTVSATNNFLYAVSYNYVVGDKVMIDMDECPYINTLTGASRRFIVLTISSIGPLVVVSGQNTYKITFNASDLSGITFNVGERPVTGMPLDCRLKLRTFGSKDKNNGFLECSPYTFNLPGDLSAYGGFVWVIGQPADNSLDNISTTPTDAVGTLPSVFYYSPAKFEDVYREAGAKLRPPMCKNLTSFGSQLVFGNIVGSWDQFNSFKQYNAENTIIYSDTGKEENGENNSALIQSIGETYDGPVTGLRRCNDILLIARKNSMFALDGVLESGSYSIRKIPTNFIGCISHNSILQAEGGLFFNGTDGIYFTDGVNCQKMSQIIDPFFTGIDSSKSRSALSIDDRSFLFYMTNGSTNFILVYKYEFKEWMIWDSIDASHGFYQDDNKIVRFSNVNSTYKFNSTYSDNGSPITAIYKANWEDIRMPELNKKFKYLRIWNLNSSSSSFKLTVEKNWANAAFDPTVNTVDCSIPAYGVIQKAYDQKNVHSLRYVFSNSIVGQGMLITGYEVEFESTQELDKGN